MVNKTGSFLLKTQNTIISAAFILGMASFASAFLGFLKNRLLTHYFGISNDLSIFYTADRIPSLIYSLLVVGAVSTVFIPVFTELLRKDEKQAWKTCFSMMNFTVLVFVVIGSLLAVFAHQIMELLSVGKFSPEEITLGVNLMRLMLIAQVILVVSSFATSALQSFKYFIIPALAPLFYSFGMICGTVLLSEKFGIYGPVYGILFGSILHLLVQLPLLLRLKVPLGAIFSISLGNIFTNRGSREMMQLIPARILSVLLINVIYTINNSFAILISTSSVIYLKFASQLQYFPVTLFGVSIAAAALPTLSEEIATKDRGQFKKTFLTSLHQMLFLVIPVSVILLVLRVPVVRIVFGVKNFPWDATLETALALGYFSISIWAQSAIYLITRAFYAMKDTMSPVKVSLVTIIFNIASSLVFVNVYGWGVWSLALSFSLTAFLDMGFLLFILARKLDGFSFTELFLPFFKISAAAIFMGLFLYIPMKFLDNFVLDTAKTLDLIVLCGIAGVVGMTAYLFITWLFKVEEIKLLFVLARKLNISKKTMSVPVVAENNEMENL